MKNYEKLSKALNILRATSIGYFLIFLVVLFVVNVIPSSAVIAPENSPTPTLATEPSPIATPANTPELTPTPIPTPTPLPSPTFTPIPTPTIVIFTSTPKPVHNTPVKRTTVPVNTPVKTLTPVPKSTPTLTPASTSTPAPTATEGWIVIMPG